MKRSALLICLMCWHIVLYSQLVTRTTLRNNNCSLELVKTWDFIYPLLPDIFFQNNPDIYQNDSIKIIYPTLVLNGIIIEDQNSLDKFRNLYNPDSITYVLRSQQYANRMGIKCSKDGILIVKTKRHYHLRL